MIENFECCFCGEFVLSNDVCVSHQNKRRYGYSITKKWKKHQTKNYFHLDCYENDTIKNLKGEN